MSRSVNKITLIGNVGRDPDIQQTKSGTKVAHFSLATNRRKPGDAAQEGHPDWHGLTDRKGDGEGIGVNLGWCRSIKKKNR